MKRILLTLATILITSACFAQNETSTTMAAYRDFCLKINEAINGNNADMLYSTLDNWEGASDEIIYNDVTMQIVPISRLSKKDTLQEVDIRGHVIFMPAFVDWMLMNDFIINNGYQEMPTLVDIYRQESTRDVTMASVSVSHHAIAKNGKTIYSSKKSGNMQFMVVPEFGGRLNVTIEYKKDGETFTISDNATDTKAAFLQWNMSFGEYTITVENDSDKDVSFVFITD